MKQPDNPKDLALNIYLMCPPYWSSFNNFQKNNPLMKEGEKPNYPKAFRQWLNLYSYIAQDGLVYLLPNDGVFQDQVYVANLGIVLHHLEQPTVVLSNFTSQPRQGEEKVGLDFFSSMKYKTEKSPYKFEGEADLKYIRDNIYIGGYGIRTNSYTFQWLNSADCHIIPVQMTDPKLYHFDCIFFPIDEYNAIVNTSVLNAIDIDQIEKIVNIIDVPKELRYTGITNLVRTGSIILCRDLEEKGKLWLSGVCNKHGYEVAYFPLDAFDVGGADLSCLIMSLTKQTTKPKASVIASIKNFFKERA